MKRFFLALITLIRSFFFPCFASFPDPLARDDSTIPNHFVTKFDEDVRLVAQQTKCRLQETVMVDEGIVGASKSVDRQGATEAQEIVDRHGDTKLIEAEHIRRWIDLRDYNHPMLIDKTDTLKVLENPTNKYVMGSNAAMNRKKDKILIAALGGSARTADAANPLAALPAGQKILEGGTNISLAKLLAALEILNENEADSPEEDGTMRTYVYTAAQLTVLMQDPKITSADYSTLQALQNMKIDEFMGMKWKRVEYLPKTGNIRSNYIYGKSYMKLGIGENIMTSIDKRADKNNAIQTYLEMSLGAVRVEDEGVVEVQVDESAAIA